MAAGAGGGGAGRRAVPAWRQQLEGVCVVRCVCVCVCVCEGREGVTNKHKTRGSGCDRCFPAWIHTHTTHTLSLSLFSLSLSLGLTCPHDAARTRGG